MAAGPGKYDGICTKARQEADADAIVLIVANGRYGNGMSVQVVDPSYLETLPDVLRQVAANIEREKLNALVTYESTEKEEKPS